jgi:lipid-A-disaccharide synthase
MKSGLIITGDLSGEISVLEVVRNLKRTGFQLCGTGSELMRNEGVEIIEEIKNITLTGLDIFGKIKKLRNLMKEILLRIKMGKADFLLLVDYPGFNIALGKKAKSFGIPIFYYIPPKVWAWMERRAKTVSWFSTFIFTIFPFEGSYFEKYGGNVIYAGNPVLWRVKNFLKREHHTESDRILFMPGSRTDEVKRHLPPMLEAISLLKSKILGIKCHFLLAKTVEKNLFPEDVEVVEGNPLEEISKSKIVVAKSGTGALEAFLLKKPTVVIYRTSFLTYSIAKPVVKVKYLSIPNIIFGKEIVPELIQRRCNGREIAREVLKIIENPSDDWKNYSDELFKILDTPIPPEEVVSKKILEWV